MSHNHPPLTRFDEMNLNPCVLSAVRDVGHETPTPIQALAIPHLIRNRDVLGRARTGTGKTAAFALPLLSRIDPACRRPQVLILTPTRELAIQVAGAFRTYGAGLKGLAVLPVYGGQGYATQLNQLKKGVHVLVGTPGRLMDHMRKKTISFSDLFGVVIDEADEMLQMGFIDDVEWILGKIPKECQTSLFSATLPRPIRTIAQKYLNDPEEILVEPGTSELSAIRQRFLMVKGGRKAPALTRILEATVFDGVIVFVKTKSATLDVAGILESQGFKAEALNGDMAQNVREKTVERLKSGHIDILVATDVAARGLDVDRISHVINYDMPAKADPYVHRIGRTGRAGRKGEAILFVSPNERWMLKVIERATKQTVEELTLPSNAEVNAKRADHFKRKVSEILAAEDLGEFQDLIETCAGEQDVPISRIAAALAKMVHGQGPFFLPAENEKPAPRPRRAEKQVQKSHSLPGSGMERYRIEVGRKHGVKARNIVGAISNEAGLAGKHIRNIDINQDFSFVDLPLNMPKEIFTHLKKTWVLSRPMSISKCV